MLKELKSLTDKMNLTKPHLGYMTSSRGRPRTGEHSGCGECTTRRAGAETGTKDCDFLWMAIWWFVKNTCAMSVLEITSSITSMNKVISSRSVSPEMYHKQLKSTRKGGESPSARLQIQCLKLVSSINTMEWPWHWDCRGCFTSRPWIHSRLGLPFNLRLLSDQRSSEVTSGVTIFILSPLLYTGHQGPMP